MSDTDPGRTAPIRVLHVITGLGAGGAERQLTALATYSDPAKVQHQIVSLLDEGVWGTRLRNKGVAVHTLNLKRKWSAPLILGRLVRLCRESRADIVQTWLYHADVLGLAAGKLTGRPVIWTLRGSQLRLDVYGLEMRLLVRLLTALSSLPRAVAANAEEGARWH